MSKTKDEQKIETDSKSDDKTETKDMKVVITQEKSGKKDAKSKGGGEGKRNEGIEPS